MAPVAHRHRSRSTRAPAQPICGSARASAQVEKMSCAMLEHASSQVPTSRKLRSVGKLLLTSMACPTESSTSSVTTEAPVVERAARNSASVVRAIAARTSAFSGFAASYAMPASGEACCVCCDMSRELGGRGERVCRQVREEPAQFIARSTSACKWHCSVFEKARACACVRRVMPRLAASTAARRTS